MSIPATSSLLRIQLQTVIRSLGSDLETQNLRLNEILEFFYLKMNSDVMLGFFFEGRDLKLIAHQQAKFLLNAAGLIPQFEGKGPASAHLSLPPILEGHFDRRIVILRETLQKFKLPPPIIELWISFETTFRKVVIAKN